MDSSLAILLVVGFLVLVVTLGVYSYRQQQKRIADLQAVAHELNWLFSAGKDYSYDERYPQFSRFREGDSRYAYNTLEGCLRVGQELWPARMGDYHYQTTSHNGKETQTHEHYLSFLVIELPYLALPDLRIRREGFFDTIANVFGFGDINFESAEFSKRFNVKSSSKKFAYDVIHPAMMEFLLASDVPTIEIDRGQCCITHGGSTWQPNEFRTRCEWTARFFELWPKHLIADLKSREVENA